MFPEEEVLELATARIVLSWITQEALGNATVTRVFFWTKVEEHGGSLSNH